jgi:hypothetical protein
MTAWSDLTVVTDDLSSAAWACTVRDRVINPFASAATRDATITSLVAGMHTHQADSDHTFFRSSSGTWAPVAQRIVGTRYYTGTVTSTGTEASMVAWAVADPASVVFEDKHFYRIDCTISLYNDGTANALFDNKCRCRATINSIAGQELGVWRLAAGGGSSPILTHEVSCFVHNASGASISRALNITVQKSTGGNAFLVGSDSPSGIVVWDCGPTSRVTATQLSGMRAVSLT